MSSRSSLLREGYFAWRCGDLETALKRLKPLLEECPGLPDAAFPLARTLSELGRPDEALELLGAAELRHAEAGASRVFRGIILLDHKRTSEAKLALEPIAGENVIAKALLSLVWRWGPESRIPPRISMPPGAQWIAEVAGRLLADLEVELMTSDLAGALEFHHPYRVEQEKDPSPMEVAFKEKRFAEAIRCFPDLAEKTEAARLQLSFAHAALGEEAKALAAAQSLLKDDPTNAVGHFAVGFVHARFDRRREAGWAFVRAARFGDMPLDDFLQDLLKLRGIELRNE